MNQEKTRYILRSINVLGFIGLTLCISYVLALNLPGLETKIQKLGPYAPMGFIAVFTILSPLLVSVDALCIAAGLMFPLAQGQLAVIISTYLSAAIMFVVGRHFFRERVVAYIAEHKRFARLDRAVSRGISFKLMFLLRLTPIPFAPLSYILSVREINFWPYLGATSGILIYNGSLVYFGYAAKHLGGLIPSAPHTAVVPHSLLLLGLLLFTGIMLYVAKTAAAALKHDKSDTAGE